MDIKDSVRSKGEQERNVFSKNEMETTALRQERKNQCGLFSFSSEI